MGTTPAENFPRVDRGTDRERGLRAEVYALRGAVARLEELLAERQGRLTMLELAMVRARLLITECMETLRHLGADSP